MKILYLKSLLFPYFYLKVKKYLKLTRGLYNVYFKITLLFRKER